MLLTPQDSSQPYGIKAMEEEIVSTLSIEQIDTSRDSVRKILSGYAPANESEKRIYAMKKGLEFIVDPAHQISEENLHQLYEMTIGALLPEEDRLPPGNLYRNDSVYVVGDKVEHTGLSWKKLPEYMGALIEFANMDGDMNDLIPTLMGTEEWRGYCTCGIWCSADIPPLCLFRCPDSLSGAGRDTMMHTRSSNKMPGSAASWM